MYQSTFQGQKAQFRVTSVTGHLYKRDFGKQCRDKSKVDLFDNRTVRFPQSRARQLCKQISQQSKQSHYLILWLDCDREGQNICFEIVDNAARHLRQNKGRILRAKFSSITKVDLVKSFNSLSDGPNLDQSLSVDVRQIIDLKIGVSISRLQTKFLSDAGKSQKRMITYGPCQTPTLGFCVQQAQKVDQFMSQKFWTLKAIMQEVEGQDQFILNWKRGRIFHKASVNYFLSKIKSSKSEQIKGKFLGVVKSVSQTIQQDKRPKGLNTVKLLKVASSSFGIPSKRTMQIAENLYLRGYTTYPRTESTQYAKSFEFDPILAILQQSQIKQISVNAQKIEKANPRKGFDAGDHPPITPVRNAPMSKLSTDQAKIYNFICQNFLASIGEDAQFNRLECTVSITGEGLQQQFIFKGEKIISEGYLAVMPWKRSKDKYLPQNLLKEGANVFIKAVDMVEGQTERPPHLSESDLIGKMEKFGIGTDASIPVHITNIKQRGYVQLIDKRLVPTKLGRMLVRGYFEIDPELVLPSVRSNIEKSVMLIAKVPLQLYNLIILQGKANYQSVLQHVLEMFKAKFLFLKEKIQILDQIIRNPEEKCKIQDFKHIAILEIKSQMQTRLENSDKSGQFINFCPKCAKGLLFCGLYDKAKNHMIACNTCQFRFNLLKQAKKINRAQGKCDECGSHQLMVQFNDRSFTGQLSITGCIFCEDRFSATIEKK